MDLLFLHIIARPVKIFVPQINYMFSSHGEVIDIDIHIFINCNWVVTRWQYTFTHKQYIEHK